MSIPNILGKIKGLEEVQKERLFTLILIILVGLGGFGLGQLSITEGNKRPIRIENITNDGEETGLNSKPTGDSAVFASNTGKFYYDSSCQSGSRVGEKDKIWFTSAADAEKFGLKAGC